jgi:response regulator of citrate/malate metabolism
MIKFINKHYINGYDYMTDTLENTEINGKHILVVEDHHDAGFIMKRRIESMHPDAHVEWARTSLSAQKYLYHNDVDLVFLDLNLEDSYGVESVKDIKPYSKRTPIVVTTGIANAITIEECMKAGATELLLKSNVSKEVLSETIQKHTSFIVEAE